MANTGTTVLIIISTYFIDIQNSICSVIISVLGNSDSNLNFLKHLNFKKA